MTHKENTCYMLSCWGDDKQRTWSGTNWGLYTALRKKVPVIDVNLADFKPSVLERIKRKLGKQVPADLDLSSIYRQQAALNNKTWEGVVLQFAEVREDTLLAPTFIYQDLSVDYVHYMSWNLPDIFSCSNYQMVAPQYIEERRAMQNNYYINHCHGIFTMGHWLADDLIQRTGIVPEKVHVVGGGINLDSGMIIDGPKTRNKVLFVGRDFVRKGGPLTLQAFRMLRSRIPDAELYVAGPSRDPMEGEQLPGYHFMGECSHTELSRLFNLCDVFCMPSVFEAYGLVFIEALCYGLPCIGRNRYEMPYFIEDGKTGRLLKGDGAEELCNCMVEVLEKEAYFKTVKSRRQSYLEQYSWDTVVERMISIMKL